MDCNRHVCRKDLENYLRKDEYLDNYTPVELRLVCKNIGAISKDDLPSLITKGKYVYLTHEELTDLILNNKLGIGYVYAITDFLTIYLSNFKNQLGLYETWGSEINPSKIYTILAIAVSPNKLYNRVVILSEDYPDSYEWIVEYDYKPKVLQDGVKTKGKITYLKDTNNNTAYYDFKNIKSRRSKTFLKEIGMNIEEDHLDLYTFNTLDYKEASETQNVYNNHFESGAINNVFIGNECYNNVFEDSFINNTFASSCYNNHFWFNTFDNTFKLSVIRLSGSFNNLKLDNDYISMDVNKLINKIDEDYILLYLDPITLTILYIRI